MISPQYILPLAHELVVDLFAGGGGASTGIEQAIGRHVDIAVNHDPQAVSLHETNHPQTRHYISDVFEVNPLDVTGGRPVGLMWASPDCKHFSKAKGGKPVSKKIRGLAGVVIKWAKAVRPRVICLENVEEFQTWGPLLKSGHPCPARKGQTFQRWVARLRGLGYVVEWRELRACDYGAPTIRKRLFLVARCDGYPIAWPLPTHGTEPGLKPYRTAAECIDWSLPVPSIFGRAKPLADNTMRRIAHGLRRYVLDAEQPYIVQTGPGGKMSPTLVQTGYGERAGQAPRAPGLDKPLGTVVGSQKHALVAAFLAKHFGGEPAPGKTAQPLDVPAPTVLAQGGPQALVTANLIDSAHSDVSPTGAKRWSHGNRPVTTPLPTVLASGGNSALVNAFLTAYYGSDQDTPLTDPMHTITTKHRFGLVTVRGQQYQITDVGMRMLQPRELYRAQGFPESYIIDRGADGRVLPKDAQVRMCGNSVCPPIAHAVVAANYADQASYITQKSQAAWRKAA